MRHLGRIQKKKSLILIYVLTVIAVALLPARSVAAASALYGYKNLSVTEHARVGVESPDTPYGTKTPQVYEAINILGEETVTSEKNVGDVEEKWVGNGRDWSVYSGDYCYEQMNEAERALYDKMRSDGNRLLTRDVDCVARYARSSNDSVIQYFCDDTFSAEGLSMEAAQEVAFAFLWQNPQYYFYDSGILVYGRTEDSVPFIRLCVYQEFSDGDRRAKETADVESALDIFESVITDNLSGCNFHGYALTGVTCEYEKEQLIHDLVVDSITYQYGYFDQSVYSALFGEGTQSFTVCAGYSKFFTLLCNRFGLDAVSVVYSPPNGEGHAWNRVKVDGKWYSVDCTWDDSHATNKYAYYNKNATDAVFNASVYHTATDFDRFLPALTTEPSMDYAPVQLIKQDETCTEDGFIIYECPVCRHNYKDTFTACHLFDDGVVTTPSTCKTHGVMTVRCTRCDYMKQEQLPLSDHIYTGEFTVEPTCTTPGKLRLYCGVCNRDFGTFDIAPTGHWYDANCDGVEEFETVPATCTKDREKVYTCALCGYHKVEAIANTKLGHVPVTKTVSKQSCISDEVQVTTCSRCKAELERITVNKATGHRKDTGTVTTQPTCTVAGERTYRCMTCNTVLGHETVQPAGHVWNGGVVTKEPTEDETGLRVYACERCGATTPEVIDKLPATAKDITVSYTTHVQRIGWQDYVANGESAGTTGQGLRLEGIKIKVSGDEKLGIRYSTHVQTYGWQDFRENDEMSGTSGESKRLEAIKIELTGEHADLYDVYYCVHAQTYGWLGWSKNGMPAGTAGQSKRLEAIQILVLKKGETPQSGSLGCGFVEIGKNSTNMNAGTGLVNYMTHVQKYGNQGYVSDGSISGTSGESLRLEGIKIYVNQNLAGCTGDILYRTHVQRLGWMDWVANGEMSGTSGMSLRLEAIEIKLTGELEQNYDVYYRVHAQTFGWLGWAKNGESSGTAGYSKRLEAIQIVLVPKGTEAPGSTNQSFIQK